MTRPGALTPTRPSVPLQCDRMAVDCAQELRRHGVSYVSLWPGLVQTELLKEHMMKENASDPLIKQVAGGGRGWQGMQGASLSLSNDKTVTATESRYQGSPWRAQG